MINFQRNSVLCLLFVLFSFLSYSQDNMATAKTYTLTADEAIVGSNFTNVGMTDEVVTLGTLMGCFRYKNTVWYKVTLPTGFTNLKAVLTPTDPSKKLAMVMMSSIGATEIDAGIVPTVYQTTEVCATNPGQVITSTRADKCLPTSSKGYDVYIAVGSADVTNDESAFTLEMNAIKPTCSDGCKNQDETSVDAGGTCSSAACGTCATPTCAIFDNTTEQVSTNITNYPNSGCYTPSIPVKSKLTTSYKINSGASGTIGVKISERLVGSSANPCSNTNQDAVDATRTYTLKLLSDPCPGTNILPILKNVANSMTGFNPEWQGLTVNTDYVLIVELDVSVSPNCALDEICMVSYHPTSSVPPVPTPLPCGTVGIAWRNSANTPSTSDLNNCKDKNFELKANSIGSATNGQYIAPGFDIEATGSSYQISKVRIQAGTNPYITAFSYIGTLFQLLPATYSSTEYLHNIEITVTSAGANDKIEIIDHATGDVLISKPLVIGTMVITIPPNTVKGKGIYTGPGVSNYKLNYPSSGVLDYTGSGYGVFNPISAGNGIHKINYSWNNGNNDCGSAFIEVEVKGCATPVCKVVDIDLYDDDQMTTPHTGLNFNCSSNKVYLGPKDVVTKYFTTTEDPDFTWPFPMIKTKLVPISGNLTNLKINYYNPGTGVLIETADAIGTNSHFFARKEGYTISLKKTDNTTGTYNFTSYDVITGAVIASGTLIVTSGNESAKSIVMKPTNFKGSFSCATCGSGSLIQGIDPYIDELGIGTFDPSKAGTGSHDIIYTWDNELTGSNRCSGTKTIRVNVTGGPAGTATIGDICQGTSPALITIPSASLTGTPTTFSIDWDAAANTAGLRDIVDTTIAAISFKVSKTIIAGTYNGKFSVKNSAGCSSTPVAITIKVMPNPTISPTTAEICVDASISLAGSGGSGIPNATTPWILKNSNVSTSVIGSLRSFKGLSAGDCDVVYMDNKGCTDTITIKVNGKPTISPTTAEICVDASISLAGSGGSGTPNATTPWILKNSNVSTSVIGSVRSFKGLSAGDCDVVYMDDKGCTDTVTIKVNGKPTISPTTVEICVDASISLTGSGGSGTPNATTPWTSENAKVLISGSGTSRSFKGISAGDSYVVYKDDKGCTDTVTIKINGNPTITIPSTPPIPAPFILEGKDSILSVSGGSGTGGAIAWKSSSPANATVVGLGVANQTAKVSGVLLGNTDIIYTDSKGCDDTVNIAISIPGCNAITKITSDQTWCQDIDPPALEFSTTETATDGISFIVVPPGFPKPADATAIYAGIVFLKETAVSGKVSLDIPKLGTTGVGAIPIVGALPVVAGDYYIYAILTTPNTTSCRPYAEIKVTIKDTTSPLITIAPTLNLNEYTVTWKDVPAAVSYKVDTVTYVKGNVPTTPNWKSLLPNITANHTLQAPLIFPNIPFGRTLLVQVTPLDVNGVKLSCNSIREKRIDNPSCTKPILEPLNIPDTVCEGASLDLLKGKINASSVDVNFEWQDSTSSSSWALITANTDNVITNPILNKETSLAIKTNLTMNNRFVRLVGYDKATGQCSDKTLPVKILVNEIPDATISIFPDPAKLCVGDPKSIDVTFQGSGGLQPYRFDFKLDGALKDTTSASGPGDGKVLFPFNTNNPIEDSTFILDSITDKNGCTAKFTGKKVKLEVNPLPSLDFQADKTIGCYPLEVIFTDKSAATVLNTDVVWDFGNGDLDYTSLGVVKYIFQKSGDYTIRFKSTINGCWDTIQKTNYIHVKDRPEAQFSPKKTNISLIDPEIQFINSSSSNSVYYKWIFGDGSPVSNVVNPKHIYIGDGSNGLPDPGKYTVELYAYINQDCWDSTSTIITIDDEQIYYIPNTFTPNGDEKNNTFQPIFTSGFDAQNYHFLIYNRWGELIFESNNPAIGWDGTYGDKLLGNDTYTWKLQFKEKMTEKEHYLTGHVNLLK